MQQPGDQAPVAEKQLVLATFEEQERAANAVHALRSRGIAEDVISVVVRHDGPEVSAEQMVELDREAEATGTDVAVGSVAGGLAGFLAGLALFSIPGLGPFLGLGVLAGTLGGAAVGSAVGERTAHWRALGIPEEHAQHYHGALESGHVIVAVTAVDTATVTLAREVLEINGAGTVDVHPYLQGTEMPVLPDPADQAL